MLELLRDVWLPDCERKKLWLAPMSLRSSRSLAFARSSDDGMIDRATLNSFTVDVLRLEPNSTRLQPRTRVAAPGLSTIVAGW
jgi:hypothetical protein